MFRDPETGLIGALAIHSTALGPAMGGLRLSRYADAEAAAIDALRLAHAMTLKNAAAGLDVGGGKAVLVDDGAWASPTTRRARLLAFAGVVERLNGRYVTAEDVGDGTRRYGHDRDADPVGGGPGRPGTAGAVIRRPPRRGRCSAQSPPPCGRTSARPSSASMSVCSEWARWAPRSLSGWQTRALA